ncbi:MAG: hypothetical protein HYU74_07040 [Dechloromonas sp.]|nr:hypothetical protein [Dechloromonas sp.]
MNKPIDFDRLQRSQTMDDWLAECKRRMGLRFPKIEFESNCWPIRKLYKTEQSDWYFTQSAADFDDKDISYLNALRCLVAEIYIAGKPKSLQGPTTAYRLLAAKALPHQLFDLTLSDLRILEAKLLTEGKENPQRANAISSRLSVLTQMTAQLSRKGVLPLLGFHVRATTKAELQKVSVAYQVKQREGKGELLDRKMEAFNEVFNHMVNGHPCLSAQDCVAICAMVLLLCAPSRINEPLCMSIDDHVTLESYAHQMSGDRDILHDAHKMLIVTMKGSKGAQWSPKPVLSFMMDAFHYCMDMIKELGERSRMLVTWYQNHPDILYLPPDLEYLRNQAISREDLTKIVTLNGNLPNDSKNGTANLYFKELEDRQFRGRNPAYKPKPGRGGQRWKMIDYLAWNDVENLLLQKVHAALDRCRRVTDKNPYQGDLAKMLFLWDQDEVPFLPGAASYNTIWPRFKKAGNYRRTTRTTTVFEKLNITIPVGGKIQIAEMESHDPRRWLTTMAQTHGEMLSDVLINKWANRCNLSQLKAYDFRTAEVLAAQSAMPEATKLNELADLSNGLATMERLEDQFGLQTAIVMAHDAGIAMTSMDAVAEAIENRPIANSSRGIIIIYPQRFGVCFHQHHEKPCRNFSNDLSASCLTCNEAAVTKGHLPTNQEVRKIYTLLFSSVIRHLENLALTHNRNVADDPAALGEHMLTLAEKGLNKETLEQFAVHLIEEVHRINRLLNDRLLARRLEQAFVARGFIKRLDDPKVRSGALMKYHNPTQHAEPLMERALEEHGGRDQIARDEQALVAKYPRFAPKALDLKDERHLIAPDGDESED